MSNTKSCIRNFDIWSENLFFLDFYVSAIHGLFLQTLNPSNFEFPR